MTTYLPFAAYVGGLLYGKAIANGAPVAGVELKLMLDCASAGIGIESTPIMTGTTQADGTYQFIDPPAVPFRTSYRSSCVGLHLEYGAQGPKSLRRPGLVLYGRFNGIQQYRRGENRQLPLTDLTEIKLIAPESDATLPITFRWQPRSRDLMERYELDIVDFGVTGACFLSGDLGYADQLTLFNLENGGRKCFLNAGYTWLVTAYRRDQYPWVWMYVTSEYRPILFTQ